MWFNDKEIEAAWSLALILFVFLVVYWLIRDWWFPLLIIGILIFSWFKASKDTEKTKGDYKNEQ